MSIRTKRVTVANPGPTLIVAADQRRTHLKIEVTGANAVHIGKSDVTPGTVAATDGYRRAQNATFELGASDGDAVKEAHYGAAAVGASDVSVFEGID